MAKEERIKVKTPEFRVSFPKVFKAEAFKEGDEPKFSITMLFDKKAQESQAFKAMKGEAKKAFCKHHGADMWEKTPKDAFGWPVGYYNPFKTPDAEKIKKYDGYDAETIVVRASTKYKVPVVDESVNPFLDQEQFYAGCYAFAVVAMNPYGKPNDINKGVSFFLQGVQKTKDGEAFSGRANAEDMFDAVSTEGADASNDNYDF